MRLFVAFPLPEELKDEIRARTSELKSALPRARWVRSDGMHLTLAFLGETGQELMAPLEKALSGAFEPYPPLSLRVAGTGSFPPRGKARVLFLDLEAPGFLSDLQREVAEASLPLVGREPEKRPFRAHLTVARCQPPWPVWAVEKLRDSVPGELGKPFTAAEGVLYESQLLPQGARYTALARFPLRGRA